MPKTTGNTSANPAIEQSFGIGRQRDGYLPLKGKGL